MKANKDKCHFILSSKERVTMKEIDIKSSNCKRILGMLFLMSIYIIL